MFCLSNVYSTVSAYDLHKNHCKNNNLGGGGGRGSGRRERGGAGGRESGRGEEGGWGGEYMNCRIKFLGNMV